MTQHLTDAHRSLIVALDGSVEQIQSWTDDLQGEVDWVKVGMTNFYAQGPQLIADIKKKGFDIFLDLKLHDIPYQVEGAARQLATLGVGMVTIHASGGHDMIAAARRGLDAGAREAGVQAPALLAVTVLTSMSDDNLHEIGVTASSKAQVNRLAELAFKAGADGIVCSPLESSLVKEVAPTGGVIVTPGVRPTWAAAQDQARIQTPAQALANGSTHLVVGRPITGAQDCVQAARKVLAEMGED